LTRPRRSSSPARRAKGSCTATERPLDSAETSAPLKQTSTSSRQCKDGPITAISRPAASAGFPSRPFPAASAIGSIAPPGGTPRRTQRKSGPPCTLERNPAEISRKIGRPATAREVGAERIERRRAYSDSSIRSKETSSPGAKSDGGSLSKSKRFAGERPIKRQPPGVSSG